MEFLSNLFFLKQKKILFIFNVIITFFLFFISYQLKNFQIFILGVLLISINLFYVKSLSTNISLIIFSSLFIIVIIEIFLFVLNIGLNFNKNISDNTLNSTNVKNISTYLGFQPKAGIQRHVLYDNKNLIFDKKYTILSNNYRFTPKLNNNFKSEEINFFGGSNTFGWGLNDNETLPYLSQKYFINSSINNYAVSGYGVHHMYTQITQSTKLIGDKNILITFANHIPRSSCKRNFSLGTPKYILRKKKIHRSGNCGSISIGKYNSPEIISKVLNKSEIKKIFDKFFFRKNLFDEKSIILYLTLIKEINIFLDGKNKDFYVGYISEGQDLDLRIINFFKKNDIKYIDISLDRSDKENFIPFDGHPSKIANIKRSKILNEYFNSIN